VGSGEWDAAKAIAADRSEGHQKTIGADKNYDCSDFVAEMRLMGVKTATLISDKTKTAESKSFRLHLKDIFESIMPNKQSISGSRMAMLFIEPVYKNESSDQQTLKRSKITSQAIGTKTVGFSEDCNF